MRTRLSVNLNKIALIRNARGANLPDLVQVAKDCEAYGADGITVHPRPDERHVRRSDVAALKAVVTTEFNVEGNPTEDFLALVLAHRPHQATLVPDAPGALTSDAGWDTVTHRDFLRDTIARLREAGIRTSIFVDPVESMLDGAKAVGTDRIEFYTGDYAKMYPRDPAAAVAAFARCAEHANALGLGINAGHDLNLNNLAYFKRHMPGLLEVSIGQALVSDALYHGLSNTIQLYQRCLR